MLRKSLFCLFIFALIAAGILYLRYLTSPRYSFLRAENAVENKDLKTFLKFTDMEGLAASIAFIIKENISFLPAGTISKELEKISGKDMDRLKNIIKRDIEEYVSGQDGYRAGNLFYPYFERDSFFKGIVYEKRKAKQAVLGARFMVKDENIQIVCDFIMERNGLSWVIRRIESVWEARGKLIEEFRK